MKTPYKTLLAQVRAFVFDMDGVLTDATVLVSESGQLLRRMHIRDGYALKKAVDLGFPIMILSGGRQEGARQRFEALGIRNIVLGAEDKVQHVLAFALQYQLDLQHIAYMGDDLPDYEAIQQVGLAACPQDAVPEIKSLCHYISHKNGGQGAVRDLIEQTLKVQGQWLPQGPIQFD